jgi:hypothetical protein
MTKERGQNFSLRKDKQNGLICSKFIRRILRKATKIFLTSASPNFGRTQFFILKIEKNNIFSWDCLLKTRRLTCRALATSKTMVEDQTWRFPIPQAMAQLAPKKF